MLGALNERPPSQEGGLYAALSPIWVSTTGEREALPTLVVLGALLALASLYSLAQPGVVATEWLNAPFGALPASFQLTVIGRLLWNPRPGKASSAIGRRLVATTSRPATPWSLSL
jgi:hypothetical protein